MIDKTSVLLRLAPKLKKDLIICAMVLGLSTTELVRKILKSYIDIKGSDLLKLHYKSISSAKKIEDSIVEWKELFDFDEDKDTK